MLRRLRAGGNDRQLVRAARRRFRPQRSDTAATRGGGAWRTAYADVSEYELGASGLPRVYVSPQQPWKN